MIEILREPAKYLNSRAGKMAKAYSLEKRLEKWGISYSPYSDLFQIFDEHIFSLQSDRINNKKIADLTMSFEKSSNLLLLVELRNAYTHIGDVENMNKKDIIRSIMKYMEHHD